MVPFDVPHVAHDMILRFMGMDFSQIFEGSARIPSAVGADTKPLFTDQTALPIPTSTKSPQQDKAKWEAYYNAGSAALVLVVIALFVGLFLCWKRRRGDSKLRLPMNNRDAGMHNEERVPLTQASVVNFNDEEDQEQQGGYRQRAGSVKGKERAIDPPSPQPPIFDVGDSDDEEYHRDGGRRD